LNISCGSTVVGVELSVVSFFLHPGRIVIAIRRSKKALLRIIFIRKRVK
jgi:hypothetical protein